MLTEKDIIVRQLGNGTAFLSTWYTNFLARK